MTTEPKCNKSCRDLLARLEEDSGRLADLLGHDREGHRAMSILAKAGLNTVEAVAAVDWGDIKDLPYIGDVAVDRVRAAVITDRGTWPRIWTIERITGVLGFHAHWFETSVTRAPLANLPAVVQVWVPLAEKVWAGELVVGTSEMHEEISAVSDRAAEAAGASQLDDEELLDASSLRAPHVKNLSGPLPPEVQRRFDEHLGDK